MVQGGCMQLLDLEWQAYCSDEGLKGVLRALLRLWIQGPSLEYTYLLDSRRAKRSPHCKLNEAMIACSTAVRQWKQIEMLSWKARMRVGCSKEQRSLQSKQLTASLDTRSLKLPLAQACWLPNFFTISFCAEGQHVGV
eukprot:1159295-Pelagomonas_calceolata.AAC.2